MYGYSVQKNGNKLNYQKYSYLIQSLKKSCKNNFQPGRSITGDAGYLLTKIIYVKKQTKDIL